MSTFMLLIQSTDILSLILKMLVEEKSKTLYSASKDGKIIRIKKPISQIQFSDFWWTWLSSYSLLFWEIKNWLIFMV